jgi:hypothetical protein
LAFRVSRYHIPGTIYGKTTVTVEESMTDDSMMKAETNIWKSGKLGK